MAPLAGTRLINKPGFRSNQGSTITAISNPQALLQPSTPRISGLTTDSHEEVEGEIVYVADGVTRIIKFEEGTLYSPILPTQTHGSRATPPPLRFPHNVGGVERIGERDTLPYNASPFPPIAKPDPDPPAPAQTQPPPVSNPMNVPGALTGLTPRPTATATTLSGQDANPTPTDPSLPTPSQGGVRDVGKFTSVGVTTNLVTDGVYTTSFTTTLSDGKTSVVVRTATGLHTVTTTIQVPTQISTISSKTGPPVGIIVGVIGAIVIVILALVAFCILKHKRRRQNKYFQADTGIPSPPANPAVETPVIPHPFLGTLSAQEQPAGQGGKSQLEFPYPAPHHERPSDRGDTVMDPFRDPEAVQDQADSVPRTRNVLDRLQELTREVEEELRELGDRTRSGQLSDSERERLDEIRRTTGLTIVYDRRRGRVSSTSSASSCTTSPPSYHSGYD